MAQRAHNHDGTFHTDEYTATIMQSSPDKEVRCVRCVRCVRWTAAGDPWWLKRRRSGLIANHPRPSNRSGQNPSRQRHAHCGRAAGLVTFAEAIAKSHESCGSSLRKPYIAVRLECRLAWAAAACSARSTCSGCCSQLRFVWAAGRTSAGPCRRTRRCWPGAALAGKSTITASPVVVLTRSRCPGPTPGGTMKSTI